MSQVRKRQLVDFNISSQHESCRTLSKYFYEYKPLELKHTNH